MTPLLRLTLLTAVMAVTTAGCSRGPEWAGDNAAAASAASIQRYLTEEARFQGAPAAKLKQARDWATDPVEYQPWIGRATVSLLSSEASHFDIVVYSFGREPGPFSNNAGAYGHRCQRISIAATGALGVQEITCPEGTPDTPHE